MPDALRLDEREMGYLNDPINPPAYLVLCRRLYTGGLVVSWWVRDSHRGRFKKAVTNTDVDTFMTRESPYTA